MLVDPQPLGNEEAAKRQRIQAVSEVDVHECDPSDFPHGDEFWDEVYADSGLRDDDDSSYEFFSSDEWMVSSNAAPP